MVHCIAAVSAQSLDDDRAARGRPWDLDQSRLDRRHPGNSHQTSLPTGGPHSSSRWRFSGLMPATNCSNLYLRRRPFGLAISTTSLPSRTSMLAALPTQAPISCANALGIRSARLLPHFRNAIFMIRITPRKYLQCRYVMARRQVLRALGQNQTGVSVNPERSPKRMRHPRWLPRKLCNLRHPPVYLALPRHFLIQFCGKSCCRKNGGGG